MIAAGRNFNFFLDQTNKIAVWPLILYYSEIFYYIVYLHLTSISTALEKTVARLNVLKMTLLSLIPAVVFLLYMKTR